MQARKDSRDDERSRVWGGGGAAGIRGGEKAFPSATIGKERRNATCKKPQKISREERSQKEHQNWAFAVSDPGRSKSQRGKRGEWEGKVRIKNCEAKGEREGLLTFEAGGSGIGVNENS